MTMTPTSPQLSPTLRQARRAKVLSVDPNGLDRSDIDGHDRQRVFSLLRSFDHQGLSAQEFIQRTLELITIPDINTAEDVLRHYVSYYAEHAGDFAREVRPADLALADDILQHRFTSYGESFELPARIDWDDNPGTGHWMADLNRFSFLDVLMNAFRETGEWKYARKAVNLIIDWIEDTDVCDAFIPGADPNVWIHSCKKRYVWLSHLEPAIHIVAWGRTIATLLREAPELLSPFDFLRILKSVHEQLNWLEIIIPEGGHGNGLILGAGHQLLTLAYFPYFRDAETIAATAMARLEATIDKQVLPDGVQHELTPHYHFCVTKDLLNIFPFEHLLPVRAPDKLRATLRAMLNYTRNTLTPDGKQVAFNDGDGGLGTWTANHLGLPMARAIMGEDADIEMTSCCYPYAGVMIMRQGSRHGRDELYMAFDGGPYGNVHQHEDKLSFWLSAYGRSFIVDPGRHLYDYSEQSFYPYLQTTKAHSTIRIDDQDQHSKAHRERWVSWEPLPLTWEIAEDGVVTAGADYNLGYGPDLLPVRHTRTVRFYPNPGYWVITDEITGEGRHDIESRLQFAPGELLVAENIAHTAYPDANLAVLFRGEDWDTVMVEKGLTEPRAGWYSDRVNHREPAPALALYRQDCILPFRTTMVLRPYRGTDLPDELASAGQAHVCE